MRKIILIMFICISGSCAHSIHQVHTSSFDKISEKSEPRMIEARSQQFVFLWFAYDTTYVDDAYNDLLAQCSRGKIDGITTQHSTSLGFFSWHNKILMKALCYQ